MVVDTSIILAIFFDETQSQWAATQLNQYASELRMSTVNLTEVLIRVEDKQPQLFAQLRERLMTSSIRFVPPDIEQAKLAAKARIQFPINLGDCFSYALAKKEKCSILTLDADFRKVDCPILMP